MERRVAETMAARLGLEEGLRGAGLHVADSDANFLWVKLPLKPDEDAAEREREVLAGLCERGVLVRAGTSLGEPGAMRITVGTPSENDRCVSALRELQRSR